VAGADERDRGVVGEDLFPAPALRVTEGGVGKPFCAQPPINAEPLQNRLKQPGPHPRPLLLNTSNIKKGVVRFTSLSGCLCVPWRDPFKKEVVGLRGQKREDAWCLSLGLSLCSQTRDGWKQGPEKETWEVSQREERSHVLGLSEKKTETACLRCCSERSCLVRDRRGDPMATVMPGAEARLTRG